MQINKALSMKKHITIAIALFVVMTWCSYAINFDETPLERNTFIGISMSIGFLPTAIIANIIAPIVFLSGMKYLDVYVVTLPFVTGALCSLIYLAVVVVLKKREQRPQHLSA